MNNQPAILLVDHGSKREAANAMLDDVAALVRQSYPDALVAIAHMELAEPTVQQGVDALVAQGATHIVIHPYFLGPGRHATQDIPALATAAAEKHPAVTVEITEPLGLHPKLAEVIMDRVKEAKPLST